MHHSLLFPPLLLAILCLWPVTAGALSANEADSTLTNAAGAEVKAQEQADAWQGERAGLVADDRDMAMRRQWLQYQIEKHQAYIQRQQQKLDEMRRRKEVFANIQMRLEPFMDETLERLEATVAEGLPFLREERTHRLRVLRDALNDHTLSLGEKLRRTLEALRVEAEYGKQLEVTETVLPLDGSEVQAKILRIGRVGMFYSVPDGRIGRYDPASKQWQSIDAAHARALQQVMEMAERRRAVDLVSLPFAKTPKE